MFAFIKTQSKVIIAETIVIRSEGVEHCLIRVAVEMIDGTTKQGPWHRGCMSEKGTLIHIAKQLNGTLFFI